MKHRAPIAALLEPRPGVGAENGPDPDETVQGKHVLRKQGAVEPPGTPLPPATAKWRTRSLSRAVVFACLVVAAIGAGLAGRLFAESRTDDRMQVFVAAALTVAGLWAVLTATAPQVVTLRGSILTVKSRRGTDRFDLADGLQVVELNGQPRSSRWSLVLYRGDASTVVLRRRHVDARVLDPLVRQFREISERRRAERWTRLGL